MSSPLASQSLLDISIASPSFFRNMLKPFQSTLSECEQHSYLLGLNGQHWKLDGHISLHAKDPVY